MEDQILRFIDGISPIWLYVVLFTSSFVETIFPPYPGDTVIVFASFAAARQELSISLVLTLSVLGSYLGALLLWALGHTWSENPQGGFIRWLSRSGSLDQARGLVRRRGTIIVVLSRFVPGVRSLILLAAGLAGMRFRRIVWSAAAAVIIWQTILVAGGFTVGLYWMEVVTAIGRVGLVFAAAFLIVVIFAWRRIRGHRATQSLDGDDVHGQQG